jgi:hypothetical protein
MCFQIKILLKNTMHIKTDISQRGLDVKSELYDAVNLYIYYVNLLYYYVIHDHVICLD